MDYGLEGKTALVVGGATGIGFAAASLMGREGMRVAVADINADSARLAAERLTAAGIKAIGIRADVTKLEDVFSMVAQIEGALGPVDVLLNSAAVLDDKLFLESSPQDWDRMLKVCLYGPMNVLHAVLPGMVQRRHGRVICMASDSARVGQARGADDQRAVGKPQQVADPQPGFLDAREREVFVERAGGDRRVQRQTHGDFPRRVNYCRGWGFGL